jgi:hypothetical protein
MMAVRVSAGNWAKAESRGANSVTLLRGLAMAAEKPARRNSLRMTENSVNCANAAPIWAGSTPWVVGAFGVALSSSAPPLHPPSVIIIMQSRVVAFRINCPLSPLHAPRYRYVMGYFDISQYPEPFFDIRSQPYHG